MAEKIHMGKIEMRAFAILPICKKCEEIKIRQSMRIVSADETPRLDTWVCPKCQAKNQAPAGMFPRIVHEQVECVPLIVDPQAEEVS